MKSTNLLYASIIFLCLITQHLLAQDKVIKLIENGLYDKAEKYCSKQKGAEQITCFNTLGEAYFNSGLYEKSGEYYEKSDSKNGLEKLGDYYFDRQEYEQAVYYYEKAYSENSEKMKEAYIKIAAGFYINEFMGHVSYSKNVKDYDNAIKYYEKAYADDDDKLKEKYIEIGKAYYDLEEYEKAGMLYDNIGYKEGLESVGDVYFKRKNLDTAIVYYDKAADLFKISQDKEKNKSLYYYSLWTDKTTEQVYKTVSIGTQVWMAENLNNNTYNDGTPIHRADNEWMQRTGAYCWYQYDSARYDDPYGRFYNWYAVNTGKLCPVGWHVPSNEEWKALETFLKTNQVFDDDAVVIVYTPGGLLKEAGFEHWKEPNESAINASGFTALPGGFAYTGIKIAHITTDPGFKNIEKVGYYHSSTEASNHETYDFHQAFCFILYSKSGGSELSEFHQGNGSHIRCIKD